MIRSSRGIIADAIRRNPTRDWEEIADIAIRLLRANGWHLVSYPTVSVVPEEEIEEYVRGMEEVRVEGRWDGQVIHTRLKIHSQMPDGAVAQAKQIAAGRYAHELGRQLGLPL